MRVCVVPNCDSNSERNPEMKFFNIPKLNDMRNEWLDVLSLKRSQLTEMTRVCELHFRPKDFGANKKTLKSHAVPIRKTSRSGRFNPDDSEDEFMDDAADSDSDVVEVKRICKDTTVQVKKEPEEKKKEVPEPEPSRRPSRRAAQLAVQKIHESVRNLGSSALTAQDEHIFKPRKHEKPEPRKPQQTRKIRPDYKQWHSIKSNAVDDIDLMMECHEELLSPAQLEMLVKSQIEYNNVMKILRTLKSNNTRIICTNYNDEVLDPPASSAPKFVPLVTPPSVRMPNVITVNPKSIGQSLPSGITVLPLRLIPASGIPGPSKTLSVLKPTVALTGTPVSRK